MKLKELLIDVPVQEIPIDLNENVKDIKINSKNVEQGDIFVALKGDKFNGNDYIEEAINNGCKCIISDEKSGDKIIKVSNARESYSLICKNYFDRACEKLKIVAVTGTNGKTTTTNAIYQVLTFNGKKVGLIGTLGAYINGKKYSTNLTTPDPYDLHKLFKEMVKEDCEYAVMEASAHALALDKLSGINFEIGVLTNITEDHLDFFKNMDNYSKAKYKLFDGKHAKFGLVHLGDDYCKKLVLYNKMPLLSYGIENGSYKAKDIKTNLNGSTFTLINNDREYPIDTNLIGKYNIENAIACIGVCKLLGLNINQIQDGLKSLTMVPGRYNVINYKDTNVIIDYAHTPDGLQKVIETTRELAQNQEIVVVFGCGGNRDKLKRPIMGEIASKFADHVVLTSDNPRFEDPYDILLDIEQGLVKPCKVIENRKKAIEFALRNYSEGQIIIIAGKGAEEYQDIKGKKIPYSDFDVVYNFLKKKSAYEINNNKKIKKIFERER